MTRVASSYSLHPPVVISRNCRQKVAAACIHISTMNDDDDDEEEGTAHNLAHVSLIAQAEHKALHAKIYV